MHRLALAWMPYAAATLAFVDGAPNPPNSGVFRLLRRPRVPASRAGVAQGRQAQGDSGAEADELAGPAATWFEAALRGGYPAPMQHGLDRSAWLASYLATYVERDVRSVLQVTDLLTFQSFLRLCAGRAGQLLNLTQLGNDAGLSHNTVKAWISVLETTFIAFRLAPWHANLGKREVKTPKLYFWDTGLLCWLLGVRTTEHLLVHPLRGAVSKVLAHGIGGLHPSAQAAVAIGAVLGVLLTLTARFAPKRLQPFVPSASGVGVAMVVPVASGFIAGESLMGILVAMLVAFGLLSK